MKWLLISILLLLNIQIYSQSGEFGIGAACVYQKWTGKFVPAPMVNVTVNRTLFSFSTTLNTGRGKKLSSLAGSDWLVTGKSMKTIGIGYFLKPEEDLPLWIVPVVGGSFVSEILQTNTGWIYGQPRIIPAFRIEIHHTFEKSGIGYWLGFGSIEMGSIGITWRYKN
jgi:hypothetical protein